MVVSFYFVKTLNGSYLSKTLKDILIALAQYIELHKLVVK